MSTMLLKNLISNYIHSLWSIKTIDKEKKFGFYVAHYGYLLMSCPRQIVMLLIELNIICN